MQRLGQILRDKINGTGDGNTPAATDPKLKPEIQGKLVDYSELVKLDNIALKDLYYSQDTSYVTKIDIRRIVTDRKAQANTPASQPAVEQLKPQPTKARKSFSVEKPSERHSVIKLWVVLKNDVKPEGWVKTWYSYDFEEEREFFKGDHGKLMEAVAKKGSAKAFCQHFHGQDRPLNGYEKLLGFLNSLYEKGVLLHYRMYLNRLEDQDEDGEFRPMLVEGWSAEKNQAV
jgi:hypothetical protein